MTLNDTAGRRARSHAAAVGMRRPASAPGSSPPGSSSARRPFHYAEMRQALHSARATRAGGDASPRPKLGVSLALSDGRASVEPVAARTRAAPGRRPATARAARERPHKNAGAAMSHTMSAVRGVAAAAVRSRAASSATTAGSRDAHTHPRAAPPGTAPPAEPAAVFPTESFVSKQELMAPHVDGDRVRPALLSAYWPRPAPPQGRRLFSTPTQPTEPRPPGSDGRAAPAADQARPRMRRQEEAMILMELVKLRLRYSLRDDTTWSDVFESFDADHSGALDYKQFTRVIREGGKLSRESLSDKDLRSCFEQIDLARSGGVSFEEFNTFVQSENPYFEVHVESLKQRLRACGPSMEDWVKMFVYYDEDKTGLLDLRELKSLVRREARVGEGHLSDIDIEKLFVVMDVGRDGRISVDDFMYFMSSTSRRFCKVVQAAKEKMLNSNKAASFDWAAIFKEADADKSGHLSLAELHSAIRYGGKVNAKTLSNFEIEALFCKMRRFLSNCLLQPLLTGNAFLDIAQIPSITTATTTSQ